MKILLVSHVPDRRGGAERTLQEIAVYLHRQPDTEVTVVVPGDGEARNRLEEQGVPTKVLPYGWGVWSHTALRTKVNLRGSFGRLVAVRRLLEEIRPDVVMTNVVVIPWFAFVCTQLGIPHVSFIREYLEPSSRHIRIYPSLEKHTAFLVRHSDKILVNSIFLQKYWEKFLPVPLEVVYPVISSEILQYRPHPPRDDAETVKVAVFGALSPAKNQLEALQAVEILARTRKDFEVVVVGSDRRTDYRKKLVQFVRQHHLESLVTFAGYENDVYAKLAESDVCIIPYINEPFGRATVEAMLLGCCVVVSDVGGGKEIIEACGNQGFLYPAGQPGALAKTLSSVISDRDRREAVRAGASVSAQQFVENEANLQKLRGILFEASQVPKTPQTDWLAEELIERADAARRFNSLLHLLARVFRI